MREVFTSLQELFGYYQFLKLKQVSQKTLMPRTVRLPNGEFMLDPFPGNLNSFSMRSEKELNFALIGDVERFVECDYYRTQGSGPRRPYVPVQPKHLLLIFHCRFCDALTPHKSYGELAIHFRYLMKKDIRVPRRLGHRQNIEDIASDMKTKAQKHFIAKGYVEPPPKYIPVRTHSATL
jgi:hypothetical protein